jgi:hypothetical protein
MAEETKTESNMVDEHKKMVMMTGNLSDFQLQNMKTWPFLLFSEELETVQIDYDFTKLITDKEEELSPGMVQYSFKFKEGTDISKELADKQLSTLSLWTKFLFWKETEVKFLKNGEEWQI